MKVDQIEIGTEVPQERKLYQGLTRVAPMAVSPNATELGKLLGTEIKQDIVYDNGEVMRLDFWCKIIDVNKFIKVPVFISNEDVISKTGNPQWINAYGQTVWLKDRAAIDAKNANATEDWQKIKTDGLRIAKKGEATVYEFLMKAFNASSNKPFPVIENWKKLTTGNVKELKEVIDSMISKDRSLHVLLGVKDGKYQDVWTSAFLPAIFTQKSEQAFMKKATDPLYPFKAEWGANLKFREFLMEAAPSEIESEAGVVDDLPWDNPSTPTKMF